MRRNILLPCALLFTMLVLAKTTTAAPFPRRGYVVTGPAEADIGRRASPDAAQRAAMRMLSRLIRWYPHEPVFNVSWQTLSARGKIEEDVLAFICDPDTMAQELHGDNTIYLGVTKRIIRKVARRNGKFRDVTRYDAVDLHSIAIDLGTYASYDAGRRATMRVLARRLRSPFAAEYQISWKYHRPAPRPDRRIGEITVDYNPAYLGSFVVHLHIPRTSESYPDDVSKIIVSFESVSQRAIKVVGRRSGTFKQLRQFGAKGYCNERIHSSDFVGYKGY